MTEVATRGDKLVWYSFIVALVGTVFDGWFSYMAVSVWQIGREANPLLNSVTDAYYTLGVSDPFALVMVMRVILGCALVWALWSRFQWSVDNDKVTWITYKALPFVAVVLSLLALYHVVAVFIVRVVMS